MLAAADRPRKRHTRKGRRHAAHSPPPDAICQCSFVSKSEGQALLSEKLAALGITAVSSDLAAVSSVLKANPLPRPPTAPPLPCCLCLRYFVSPACVLHHAFNPDCPSLRPYRPLHRAGCVCVCRICYGARRGVQEEEAAGWV